jgi:glycerate kinase
VDNPLCGSNGASAVYGPQKGLDSTGVKIMDAAMQHYASVVNDKNGYANSRGAGAAGGLGYAFLSFLHGELKSGAQLVLDTVRFADCISDADYLITGEGRMDSQTSMGKAPYAAAAAAKAKGTKVIAFAGTVVSDDGRSCAGMDAVFPIQSGPVDLAAAMKPELCWNRPLLLLILNTMLSGSRLLICCLKLMNGTKQEKVFLWNCQIFILSNGNLSGLSNNFKEDFL